MGQRGENCISLRPRSVITSSPAAKHRPAGGFRYRSDSRPAALVPEDVPFHEDRIVKGSVVLREILHLYFRVAEADRLRGSIIITARPRCAYGANQSIRPRSRVSAKQSARPLPCSTVLAKAYAAVS